MNVLIGAGSGSGPVFDPGALSVHMGPSPELVGMAAQRLGGIARDVDAVRTELGRVDVQQWRSPAAAVFRETLTGMLTELWAVVQAVDDASRVLDGYGRALAITAGACASPMARQGGIGQGGIGQSGMAWGP